MIHDISILAKAAGQEVMAVYNGNNFGQKDKTDGSPLTAADLASHQAIIEGLQELTPDWHVLSEESAVSGYEARSNWKRFWLIDPLDGTKEFIKRNGEFTVNIALIEDGKPILGVVYAPVLDVCYFAAQGCGAYVQRGSALAQTIQVKPTGTSKIIKVVASRSHSDARTAALLKRLGDHECISMGSSLKLCLVAEGVAHLYPRLGPTMEWDTAAAHAVVAEAGGTVCDAGGAELCYNKPDLHNPEFFVCDASDKRLLSMMRI